MVQPAERKQTNNAENITSSSSAGVNNRIGIFVLESFFNVEMHISVEFTRRCECWRDSVQCGGC